MSLKNETLIGGWLLIASKVYRRENLACRFEDWLYKECRIKRQTSHNYRNLYKLMSDAPKLMNCRVNATYFFKNHEVLFKYLMKWKPQYPGNMCFLVHLKIVFLTFLENLLLYTNKVFKFCRSFSRG